MNEYPDWIKGKTPHTDKNAKPVKFCKVHQKTVIEVKGGSYRNAPLDGIFELINPPQAELPGRLLVRCSWFA